MNQNLEVALIEKYQLGNITEKKNVSEALWKKNKKWIHNLVGKRASRHIQISFDEMLSVACVAFYDAINTYDLSKAGTVKLKTHSVYWINGALIKYAKTQMYDNYAAPRCLAEVRNEIFNHSIERCSLSNQSVNEISDKFQLNRR
ncbi:MAG: hypothetical protein JKY54_18590, partial [Flavobacteriales bacterium]|nr:hypothetical protein [Flavobacteriales bacterium]